MIARLTVPVIFFGGSILAGCTCSDELLCPESFTVGEACEVEGQECIYPQSRCGTPCRCVNQPGGFVWECATQYCKCTCSCGRYAIASCELLECTQEDDPCVPQAEPLCEMVCSDDAGPDGAVDAGADLGPRELGPDAPGDAAADTPRPREAAVDQAADTSPDQAADTSPDQAADTSPDQAADTSPDIGGDTSVDQ